MEPHKDFTKGKIIGPLFGFAGPILFALFLQAMYGAIDLAVVGQIGLCFCCYFRVLRRKLR